MTKSNILEQCQNYSVEKMIWHGHLWQKINKQYKLLTSN